MPVLLSADDPADFQRWNDLVDGAPTPDVYYRPGYARAYQAEGEGRAVALHLETPEAAFLFPMLLRPLSSLAFAPQTPGHDAVTPYGYGGLLRLRPAHPSAQQLRAGLDALAGWCRSNGVISALLRLHPLLEQDREFKAVTGKDLSLHLFGPTTAIALDQWSESSLRKGRRSDLGLARRSLRTTWSSTGTPVPGTPPLAEALRIFRDLYESTMDRLGAADFYHFSPDYYATLAEGLGACMAVALAWQQEKPVGGSIFFADRAFAHYHLSATNETGRASKATTLLIHEAIDWSRARGCRFLHLGGGVRGDDSLFAFKQGFGGDVYQYAFAGLICDLSRYEQLQAARRSQPGAPPRPNYFPAYRA